MKKLYRYFFVFLLSFSMIGITACKEEEEGIVQESKEKVAQYYNDNASNIYNAIFESYSILDEEVYTYANTAGEILEKERRVESSTYDKENYKYSNRKIVYDKDDKVLSSVLENAKEDAADFDIHFNIEGTSTKVPPAYVDIKVKELYVKNHADKFGKFYNMNPIQIEQFIDKEIKSILVLAEKEGKIIDKHSYKVEYITLENEIYEIKVDMAFDSYNYISSKLHEYSYTETYSYKFNKSQFINFSSTKTEIEKWDNNGKAETVTETTTRNIDYTTSFDSSLYVLGGPTTSTPLANSITIYLDYENIGTVSVREDSEISDILSSYNGLNGMDLHEMKCYDVYCTEKYSSGDILELFGKPKEIYVFTNPTNESNVFVKYTKSTDGNYSVFESVEQKANLGEYQFSFTPEHGVSHYLYDDLILVNGEEISSNSFNITEHGVYVVVPVLEIKTIAASERAKVRYYYNDLLLGEKEIDKENMHILDFIDSDKSLGTNNFSFIPYNDKALTQPFEFSEILGNEDVNIYFDIIRNDNNYVLLTYENMFDDVPTLVDDEGYMLGSLIGWEVEVGTPRDYQEITINGKSVSEYSEFELNDETGMLTFLEDRVDNEFVYFIVVR